MTDDASRAGVAEVLAYHDRTKHAFDRFAPALGYLDWATQPDPFRRYAGAPVVELPRRVPAAATAGPLTLDTLGECLRCAFGLTAWKQAGASRWALRSNPSSGNLHPTEAYVVAPEVTGEGWRVSHYAPREHALEQRAALGSVVPACPAGVCLVGLSSVHWREAWKYGERAFRYCQHDVGHAIGALIYAATTLGWRVRLLDGWSDADVAALLGVDRPLPKGVEVEHPDCLLAVGPGDVDAVVWSVPDPWLRAARVASWQGDANALSPSHVEWPAIDAVTVATQRVTRAAPVGRTHAGDSAHDVDPVGREWLIRRRSAVAFDGRGRLDHRAFARMAARLIPGGHPGSGLGPSPVWAALPWEPRIHPIWFVHRVDGLAPGIYAQPRVPSAISALRAGLRSDLLWEPVAGFDGLFLLAPLDARGLARRLSCDQDIAADGFIGMAMLAPLASALDAHGPACYRELFWESGLIGQVLYLEAERSGGRATGIGCFYDDAVHDVLGITGHTLQSLYHFSMGEPVEDRRLTTEPGYAWD